jgi:hypothetical protein
VPALALKGMALITGFKHLSSQSTGEHQLQAMLIFNVIFHYKFAMTSPHAFESASVTITLQRLTVRGWLCNGPPCMGCNHRKRLQL